MLYITDVCFIICAWKQTLDYLIVYVNNDNFYYSKNYEAHVFTTYYYCTDALFYTYSTCICTVYIKVDFSIWWFPQLKRF